jgi:hypothetical protein
LFASFRRLQRSNEELLSQAEGYEVQIEHLGSRLRAVQPSQTDVLMASFGSRRQSRNNFRVVEAGDEDGDESVLDDLGTSEESLPIFDDDDDEELELSHEIETDV